MSFQSVAHIAKMKKRKKISGYLFTCIVVKPLRSWVKGGFSNKGQGKNIGFQAKAGWFFFSKCLYKLCLVQFVFLKEISLSLQEITGTNGRRS